MARFTSGEGCFFVEISKSKTKLREAVKLRFLITQHCRDEQLMQSLIQYWDCGNVSKNREVVQFRVHKFLDITDKILPLFQKYPILGEKSKDFDDFCKVVDIMKVKGHLTAEGLDQIHKIKAGMNRGRK